MGDFWGDKKKRESFESKSKYFPLSYFRRQVNLLVKMRLSKEELEEIENLYYREFNEKISDEEAEEIGERLLLLFRVIYRPIPKKDIGNPMNESKHPELP